MSEIVGLPSLLWGYIKSSYMAISSASGLFLSKSLKTESTDWATLLTDIIAVSAALGALALPLSLSVIEATRSRYKSPTLLSIYTEVSKTSPQKINRLLFGTLVFTLFLKLAVFSNAVEFEYLLPFIFGLVVFFSVTISELYTHLSFTYRLMSDVNSIRDDLLARLEKSLPDVMVESTGAVENKKLKKKKKLAEYNSQVVAALLELETYDICSTPSKRGLEGKLKAILFRQLHNLPASKSEVFMQDALGAFPRMMAEVETSRELDVYQTVSGLYLYLLPNAVMASNTFAHHLNEAVRISRFREHSLPPYGQFCRNGRIFLNCIIKKPNRDAYALLLEHFRSLLWNALHTNPENIPQILNNADNLLLGTGYDDDPSYSLHYSINALWTYERSQELTRTIKSCIDRKITIEALEQKLTGDFKPSIIEFLSKGSTSLDTASAEEKISNGIDDIITSITLREISAAIEIETLQTLGLLLEKNPDLIIKCRERKNPAGAVGFNIGRPLVPSSLNACVNAFIYEKNFTQNISINDLLEFKIVDAIGVLAVYELWKDFVFSTSTRGPDEYLSSLVIPNCTIRELKSAYDRIEVLEKSFEKILSNKMIAEKLSLLEAHQKKLSKLAKKLCQTLREKISAATISKVRNDPLDSEALNRFRSELVDEWRRSPALIFLKHIRLAKCKSFTFTMMRPRQSFLADTGIHYMFNHIGQPLLNDYLGHLLLRLLKSKGLMPSVVDPSPFGTVIILTRKALSDLIGSGYEQLNVGLNWPGRKHKMPLYIIESQESLYYQVYNGQRIFDVDYSKSTDGLPITIEHKDNKEEEIETSIRFNFSLSHSFSA